MSHRRFIFSVVLFLAALQSTYAADGNRLTYLDEFCDPYYVGRDFPKLTTPQWVGEEEVEAVVVLAIDDMRDTAKYEAYLRPILERLKQIDGRAPVSVMTCKVDPTDPQLQTWLKEGLSIECHTVDHPCPLLQGGDFSKAKSTYDRCVDLMNQIPGNKPVAFRMPCCDSLNTPSPRFWTEILNKTSENGNYLQIDTSVFNITTSNDKDLPRELVFDANGQERFRKYLPFKSFVNTIEDYPYPYIIGGTCWEFPCIVPSDWEAKNIQQPNNPQTVEDMKAALDAVVIKQGTFNLVFHPHGWIRNDQIVELIDHAVEKHGKKVKFLTFREALERINANLFEGQSIRDERGGPSKLALIDLNGDGYLDVHAWGYRTSGMFQSRIWHAHSKGWTDDRIQSPERSSDRLGRTGKAQGTLVSITHGFRGAVVHDLHGDGKLDLIQQAYKPDGTPTTISVRLLYEKVTFKSPANVMLFDNGRRDAGLRFVDVNEDGFDDMIFSNGERYSLHLWKNAEEGWSVKVIEGTRGKEGGSGPVIPMIVRTDGTNNGAWFHSRSMWVQNEDTNRLPDLVDRLSFDDMLKDYQREQEERGALPGAKSAAASRDAIRVRSGMRAELVASEPLVADPVAFDWGPDGSLWVAEMGDYPNGATWNKLGDPIGEPGGRVRRLIDEDGDGKYDRSTVFLDRVPFPNGVKAWRNGVLVSAAPEIFFAEDTDGDGVADKRETLYQGFVEGNQQHRVNGLRWGLDNWLYLANGDSGGKVKSIKTGQTIDIRGRDLRIRPDTGDLEAVSGQTQFGRNRDDWGNWFGGNNSNPMWHYVLDDLYQRRNPHYAPPSGNHHISNQPGAAPVFPTSRTLTRFNDFDKADRFTSACSPMIYRDELLFGSALGAGKRGQRSEVRDQTEYISQAFICEPVHNLVHREIVRPDGATFASQRAGDEQDSEFLASSDNWFRPTMVRTGPDGAIWISDMYRLVIEHPEWIPATWQEKLDLRSGHDMGRIYRVVPNDGSRRPIARLDQLDTKALVDALDSPNGWQRDMVQQLLLWQDDATAIEPLKRLAGDAQRPTTRLHALCTLEGMDAISESLVADALQDVHPGVRRHAIRIGEQYVNTSDEFAKAVRALAEDGDMQVRLQVAYTLGEWQDAQSGSELARLAIANRDDPFLVAAALSGIREDNIANAISVALPDAASQSTLVDHLLSTTISIGRPELLQGALRSLFNKPPSGFAPWQFSTATTVLHALDRRKLNRAKLFDDELASQFRELLSEAGRIAADNKSLETERLVCIELLGVAAVDAKDLAALAELLGSRHSTAVQGAAVHAMTARNLADTPKQLLAEWQSHLPSLRAQILDRLLARSQWTHALLAAIEANVVSPNEVDARLRQQLLTHREATIHEHAAKLLSNETTTRSQVLTEYGHAAKLAGDLERGKLVFTKRCATCHRLQEIGKHVGPDLTALTDKSPTAMLVAILDPNRAVEDKFRNYVALTLDGRQFTGMITNETGNSITLTGADAKEQTILRTDLDELLSTGKSLMPEGMEKELPPQDMADVIAFARSVSAAPKQFPGNEPQIAPARDDGSIRCLAIHARIYGPTLVFEEKYRNLGYWGSIEDHVVWSLDVPKAGSYRVTIDYACDDSTAGNRWRLSVAQQTLAGVVEGTGSWDNYRSISAGEIELPAGPSELVFRSDGNIRSHLLDLRGIRLVPR